MNPRKAVCFLTVLLIASVPLALAQGTYTQIDYPGALNTFVEGINSAGDVVGYYEDVSFSYRGFLLSGGIYTTIDYPGTPNTYLYGMNNAGQIVGLSQSDILTGFLYNVQTQVFSEISYPAGSGRTVPMSINDGDTIAGWYDSSSGRRGFEVRGSTYRTISPGLTESAVFGISGSGKLVGLAFTEPASTSFSFSHGRYKRIQIPDAPLAEVFGINPLGTAIVGQYQPASGPISGFLYQNTILQQLLFPGSTFTYATGVNNAGQAAGWFLDIVNNNYHGFIWTPPADAAKK